MSNSAKAGPRTQIPSVTAARRWAEAAWRGGRIVLTTMVSALREPNGRDVDANARDLEERVFQARKSDRRRSIDR